MAEAKRVLVVTPTAEMANRFRGPAEKLALSLTLGCGDGGDLRLDFSTRDAALAILTHAERDPFAGIVAVSDEAAPVVARAASMLGLPFHTPKAADACRDKRLLGRRLQGAGLTFSCRGRSPIGDIALPQLGTGHGPIPTREEPPGFALECLMSRGQLRPLTVMANGRAVSAAAFDANSKTLMTEALRRIVPAIGLKHGPVRVSFLKTGSELCLADVSCAYVPDVATAALRFVIPLVDQDVPFEEVILRNALDLDTSRVLLRAGV